MLHTKHSGPKVLIVAVFAFFSALQGQVFAQTTERHQSTPLILETPDPIADTGEWPQDAFGETENTEPGSTANTGVWEIAEADAGTSLSPLDVAPPKLDLTLTAGWASRYMWKGFKVLDSGVYMHQADLGLWDSGFHLKFMGAYPSHDRDKSLIAGRVPPPLEDLVDQAGFDFDRESIDAFQYAVAWKGKIGNCIDVELGGDYYDLFRLDGEKGDFLEAHGIFTLSKLPLSPHFGAYYAWPYNDDKKGEGWMTDIGVSQPFPITGLSVLGIPPTALVLSADLWYNGGAWSGKVDPGWAYAEFKALLPIPIRENMTLIPGFVYQMSIEDTVDESDEVYATLAVQYKW